MEEKIFRLPAVGGLLKKDYVEARLHNDDHKNPELIEKITRLQDELVKNRATPYYLILEPESGKKLAVHPGPDLSGDNFLRFLQKALD